MRLQCWKDEEITLQTCFVGSTVKGQCISISGNNWGPVTHWEKTNKVKAEQQWKSLPDAWVFTLNKRNGIPKIKKMNMNWSMEILAFLDLKGISSRICFSTQKKVAC